MSICLNWGLESLVIWRMVLRLPWPSPILKESVNLQSIKNRMLNMIFSSYTQDSENVTYWRLQDIIFQFLLDLRRWTLSEGAYSALPNFQLQTHSLCSVEVFLGKNPSVSHTFFQPVHLWTRDFYSFEFFFNFVKCFKINDFS